ncbi:PulJ/GspJ family protein [Beggiatoa leptomitoformis]|uniref:Prepilin-type N-terminal cleavage/methylation domain-containing protein n=1 Tax=Beggiatoa leptomitoformis TaxID=288004 RepID=A0A2N9YHC2_9GAMM|nr:prepilin-type N-terminal cleavage/methylation domain-containing protein [Beggiatoa leptomitoformis]ALG68090.1 prepilin-type N-terminal cleavage/methylation domain-containing protein [Beggiatoa leptomitoformis]AUI69616.1 prepilin-type N-terminal cleavage/methylation domain-containing protein [Beggiatoa leptomitoformis]
MSRVRQTGFTLLEILIALVISAAIMTTLASGMYIVMQDWQRTTHTLDDSLDAVLILLQLERAVNGAFPHTYINQKENKSYIYFEGESEKLTWISTVSPAHQAGLSAWQLLPSESKEGGIDIRIIPVFAGNPEENLEKAEAVTVFAGYAVRFEYLYTDPAHEDQTEWFDEWSAKDFQGLPNAIRIVLEKKNDKAVGENDLEIIASIPAFENSNLTRTKPP